MGKFLVLEILSRIKTSPCTLNQLDSVYAMQVLYTLMPMANRSIAKKILKAL